MSFRIFQYTLPAPPELEELNAWLQTHRVATVTHHMVTIPGGTMLVFVVETVDVGASKSGSSSTTAGTQKIDYRSLLADDEFAVFSQLRNERKIIAESLGVPVYTIFTNAQLAQMVTQKTTTLAQLEAQEGIGKARVEKYGNRILDILKQSYPKNHDEENERT